MSSCLTVRGCLHPRSVAFICVSVCDYLCVVLLADVWPTNPALLQEVMTPSKLNHVGVIFRLRQWLPMHYV